MQNNSVALGLSAIIIKYMDSIAVTVFVYCIWTSKNMAKCGVVYYKSKARAKESI
jgi:hypothetical protein